MSCHRDNCRHLIIFSNKNNWLVLVPEIMEDTELIDKLKTERYDIYLTTPFDICSFGLNYILQIPSTNVYSVIAQEVLISSKLGLQLLPSYVPQSRSLAGYLPLRFLCSSFQRSSPTKEQGFLAAVAIVSLLDWRYIWRTWNGSGRIVRNMHT